MPRLARSFLGLTLGTGLGEAIGLAVVSVVSQLAARSAGAPDGPSPAALLLVMAVAGVAEGACIGAGQAIGLSHALDRRGAKVRYVLATATGIGIAWCLGMLGSTLEPGDRLGGSPGLYGLAGTWGVVVGAAVGLGQRRVWRFTRRSVPGWVAASALAWAGGMSVGAALSRLAPSPTGTAGAALHGALTGLAIGLVAGAVQGLAFVRFADLDEPDGAS